ncbi:protein MCM10 homolog isoform X2 [Pomacea canaliculata]|uniref:protein MCM10 homolog isoform X2 n=1 Tax=Pomacea canaliculata TaxID=400727 RepID=UPI000D73D2F0|nr:protein MCM10 homolog isoform X2 [Pomacea canaliculata]
MSIQDLPPLAQSNVTQKLLKEHDVPFLDMLATPTQGSMNLVRHIVTHERLDSGKAAGNKHNSFQSVSAASLIKQHKQEMQEKIHQRRLQAECGLQAEGKRDLKPRPDEDSGNTCQLKERQLKGNRSAKNRHAGQSANGSLGKKPRTDHTKSDGTQNDFEVKHVSDYSQQEFQNDASQHLQSQVCTKASGNKHAQSVSENRTEQDKVHSSQFENTSPSFSTTHTAKAPSNNQLHGGLPVLGKGFAPGQDISICFEKPSSLLLSSSASAAKLKAIKTIRSSGGIDKVDPNCTKKPPSLVKENVRKRLLETEVSDAVETVSGSRGEEPKKKKPRLLGGVDLNSEEVQRLLKAKSSHKGALSEAEAEREDKYFHELQKKEAMEEKMQSITSLEVTVFTCDQCKYTALAPGENCKQENHAVRRHKGKKHFFKCKSCSHRTVTLHRYPTLPCSKCGDERFEKTSMWKEKSGPKLDSEVLCLRGDEVKFLNSLHSKTFVNI